MKKLLAIIVLGLLYPNLALADWTKNKEDCSSYRNILKPECAKYRKELKTEDLETNNKTALELAEERTKKANLKIISGYTTDGTLFEFHMEVQNIREYIKIPGYFNNRTVMDKYYMKEFSNKKVVADVSYSDFANRLGKNYGGEKKFNKRYKKEIAESKINCGCEDPIYKTFLLDLETRYAYKVFHPQSNDPKLDGDFRLKKNIGKKALHKTLNTTGKIIHNIENAIGSDAVDALLIAYIIYSAADNPQGIFKKSKGSSNVPGSSSVSKSLSSGSGSVLDKKFGEVTLKQLIGASRR